MSRDAIAPGSWGAAVYDAVGAGRADESEAVHLMSGYVVAGMATTIHGISAAVWLLATHPRAWQAVRDDPAVARAVFEEALRLESPIAFFACWVTRDTELGGVPLAAGDRVITLLAAANRDERHFPEADRFNIHRSPNDHLTFWYGVHSCAGQGLARIVGPAILASLARRAERIELTAEPEHHLNNTIHGLATLPLTVAAAR